MCKVLGLQFYINLPKGDYKRLMRVLYIHCILNSWSTNGPSSCRSWKEVLPCSWDAETRVSSIGSAEYIWNLNLNGCRMYTLFVVCPKPCHFLVLWSSVFFVESRVTGMHQRAFLPGRQNKAIHLVSRQNNAWRSKELASLQGNEGKRHVEQAQPRADGPWQTLPSSTMGKKRKNKTKENYV